MLFSPFSSIVAPAATTRYSHRRRAYERRRAHRKTVKRVGVGAAGGAVIGALAGGGKGAGIGAIVGGGAGYLYDRHKKHHRRR